MKVEIKVLKQFDVKFLEVEAGVRYWEDATVNGKEDEDGQLIPFRDGEYWKPVIDIDNGVICNWPTGTVANIHYKVCDDGTYTLKDNEGNVVIKKEGYVPEILCPSDNGYGDYIIMEVGETGKINDWHVLLDDLLSTDD